MSKEIEYKVKEAARPTKEVLGEHLYHKISQALRHYEFDEELQLESRLTGMMLELPIRDLTAMLASDVVLGSNINRALHALVTVFPELESVATAFSELARVPLTTDDMGALIYACVAKLEPSMASKITGMLLELDEETLLSLLNHEDSMLPVAVEKAKSALNSSTHQDVVVPSSSASLNDSGTCTAAQESAESRTPEDKCGDVEQDLLQAHMGTLIYNEAMTAHPECAANIAGMLLEMSVKSLSNIVNDKGKLAKAIEKSYEAWLASSS